MNNSILDNHSANSEQRTANSDDNLDSSRAVDEIRKNEIRVTKRVYPQIYSYIRTDRDEFRGWQKIGYTEKYDVDERINHQVETEAGSIPHEKLWSGSAMFEPASAGKFFKDYDFHRFLSASQIQRTKFGSHGTEWFYFDGTPEKSKQLFDAFCAKGFASLQQNGKTPYTLRAEQEAAVNQALQYFAAHIRGEFLWNAKPRFGKTLAAYDLAKRLGAEKVLIVTNRPAIANSWFDDFNTFIDGYYFISEASSLKNRASLSREQYIAIDKSPKPQITFLSLQDLKGSKYFGGPHEKLRWIADLDWDLLVIDEAHEGVDTDRTDAAFDIIKRKNTLYLSGTPFKALANNKFPTEAIYNWTYLDEQMAKANEDENGPHADLPDLRLFTYRISQMTADEVNQGIEIDDQARDYAFDLNEFFATRNQKFVHETDVKMFLRNLSTNTKYPFSTPKLRDELRHTFWFVGNRVESVKALEQLLKQDDIFKEYKVIVAAGDGKTFDEESSDVKANEKSFDKVRRAIAENPRTITLSCGQLTTGVTVKEWSAVLMLTDIKSPAQYMQAAFRAQNPYKFKDSSTSDDEAKVKQSAYLFDFAPTRVLEIYDSFANALNPNAVNGQITAKERENNIRQLLNYFPVISEDVNGQMVELDAEKVLTFPNALAATEIVQARFMTNLLFNDNIKGVFHFPQAVEDILNKMPVEKNKRAETTKTELNLDDARKTEQQKQTKINENTNVILGEKIYGNNIERLVDNALSDETPEETIETLPAKVSEIAEPIIAKFKETYKITNAETDELRKTTEEKIKLAVAEYESAEIKNPEELKENLKNVIEHDFVEQNVEQQETKVVEEVQKSKEDMVREHLRAFTRTIPMFIMANASRKKITIDNFDEQISDEDFIDLTNITKEEFHKLRDGFDYDENGQRGHFDGVFDRYKFNASIAEFVAEKQKRADYFANNDDIFELIPNQKNNQIFTPRKVVQMMIDDLQRESPDLFTRTDSTFIDLYMKSGMYITEIVKKLFAGTRAHYASDGDCLKHILENQVFGLAPTGILHGITTNYIFGFDEANAISRRNFVMHDLLPESKEQKAPQKLMELFGRGGENMKFDAVVGNPPYQVLDAIRNDRESGAVNASASPVYQYFMESSRSIADKVSLIMPARWLSGAGKGLREFSRDMINDHHIRLMHLYINSQDVFSGVDIKGGVCYFLRDVSYDGPADISVHNVDKTVESSRRFLDTTGTGAFIQYTELSSIFAKVDAAENLSKNNVQSKISVRKPYGLSTDIFDSGPAKYGLPPIYDSRKSADDLEIWGLSHAKRVRKYVPQNYPLPAGRDTVGKWKVFVPYAYGGGAIGEVIPSPILGSPIQICSETFLRFGAWDTESEARAALKYLKTKFFRAMVGILKTTQHATTTFRFVPLQDFTATSDIDWSKSIAEIDQQLYAKYHLTEKEISFIETRVKAME